VAKSVSMSSEAGPGVLLEPLTGRECHPSTLRPEVLLRMSFYRGHGVGRGDRVFIHYGNRLEFFADLLAIWDLGASAVPLDPTLTAFQIVNLARAAKPRISLWHPSVDAATARDLAAEGVACVISPAIGAVPTTSERGGAAHFNLDDEALILFTSGTTGNPKGVVHTHRSLLARWSALRQSLGLEKFRRTLCLLPTHFGHGLICNALFPWLSGQTVLVVPPFQARILPQLGLLIDEHRITCMSSVPSLWTLALRVAAPPRTQTLVRVLCGSAPLSAALWRSIQAWTGTSEVINAYGLTETGSWVAGTTAPGVVPEDGLIGEPWGATIRILREGSTNGGFTPTDCATGEEGRVWIKTPALMREYLGREDLTRSAVAAGWFLTGDIGYLDDRGRLYLRGREREEINKGGIKVHPADIEAAVQELASTLEVCSFAYDDPLYGQNVALALALDPANSESIREIYLGLTARLAPHQIPARWYAVSRIARTANGKIDRQETARRCAALTPLDTKKLK
jgi:acyl-CoA synthetase (AMP-forming)/AMP-acid ligase II